MDTIRRILGEADDDEKEPKKKREEPENAEKREPENDAVTDTVTHEVANLWNSGNREDVALRFMEMSNEEAVRLVFAIGRKGALELARMVDEMLEAQGQETEGEETGASTEPTRIEPPAQDTGAAPQEHDYVREITGQPVEA
jgi:hypothetical protein